MDNQQDSQLLKDLAELKSKYTESGSQRQIDGWMKQAKDALIIANLKEHKGIQIIIENGEREIGQINNLLLNQIDLPDRTILIYKRELYSQFLSIFKDAESKIANITKQVEENL